MVSKNYVQSPNYTAGNWNKNVIVLHWWDDPSKRPTFEGTVNWLGQTRSQVSIQYVVEAGRWTQMVLEKDMAWHSGNGSVNRRSIGIEVNPRLTDGDYATTAELVADIWKRHGKKIALAKHRNFSSTNCPGTLNLARVKREAEAIYSGKPASSKPKKSTSDDNGSKPWAPGKGPWPEAYLTVVSKHNKWTHAAWVKTLEDIGLKGTLPQMLQRHLKNRRYYTGSITSRSQIGPQTVRALQGFLRDRGFYNGAIDGSRGPLTIRGEVRFLNWNAEQYWK